MKRYLITGAHGFVAPYVAREISRHKNSDVLGISRTREKSSVPGFSAIEYSDLVDYRAIFQIIKDYKPHYVIHLASFSSVGQSWLYPVECFKNNTDIFINILESVKNLTNHHCRILSVGSSEEYGLVETPEPIKEITPLHPKSPYAVARVSQEMLSNIYYDGYGLDIIMTRSFNHIGPGQSTRFAIPSFINKAISTDDAIFVGNLDVTRDFTDVRDVARAYFGLLHGGDSGDIYNVCSGVGKNLRSILDMVLTKTGGMDKEIIVDNRFLRPMELMHIVGDNSKISNRINWRPDIDLEQSIDNMIQFQRENPDLTGPAA